MQDSTAVSEYFMMRSEDLSFHRVQFQGKYSFQYIENAVFEDCVFDTRMHYGMEKTLLSETAP